jgi:two-component system, OmpR family, sensor histidine kinase CiaH
MKIFELTRIKLTIWYVLIIMAISTMFSVVIYKGVIRNVESSFVNAESRFNSNTGLRGLKRLADSRGESEEDTREALRDLLLEELENSRNNVLLNLLIINAIIFSLSSVISYYLAGKTLIPIEEVINEQKRFIADASHELKTPLTSLKTSIEVSIRSGKLPKDIKKLLQYNLEDVDGLNKLIDKLLSLSVLETKEIVFDNVDIKEIIKTARMKVKPLSAKKKIKIKVNTKNYQLQGNSDSLVELFVILFDNAIKYSNPGSEVSIDTKLLKNHIVIKVRDSGIGINKKYLPNIFDRFYRIDAARTSSVTSGFGLGLSMAKKIVENHNGDIRVSSEVSKGTVFTIRLPH